MKHSVHIKKFFFWGCTGEEQRSNSEREFQRARLRLFQAHFRQRNHEIGNDQNNSINHFDPPPRYSENVRPNGLSNVTGSIKFDKNKTLLMTFFCRI